MRYPQITNLIERFTAIWYNSRMRITAESFFCARTLAAPLMYQAVQLFTTGKPLAAKLREALVSLPVQATPQVLRLTVASMLKRAIDVETFDKVQHAKDAEG